MIIDAADMGVGRAMDRCDIHACGGTRSYRVGKLDNVRNVCARCMNKLVFDFGWKLLGGVLSTSPQIR